MVVLVTGVYCAGIYFVYSMYSALCGLMRGAAAMLVS
jgi:hypothetical protein